MGINFYMNKVFGIEVISIEASNEYYKSHNHTSHYVIGFMMKGQIQLENETKIDTLEAQDTFVIKPDQRHAVKPLMPFSLIAFSIEENFFNTYSMEESKKIIQEMKQLPMLSALLMNVNMDLILNHIDAIYQLQKINPVTYKNKALDHVKAFICENATETSNCLCACHWS